MTDPMLEMMPDSIQKKAENPLIQTLVASPVFFTVSIPLGFIVGVFINIWTDAMIALAIGVLVILGFGLLGTFTTYKYAVKAQRDREISRRKEAA